jgi:acetate kinase
MTRRPCIDDQVTSAIRDLTDLAPLRQPRALAGALASNGISHVGGAP